MFDVVCERTKNTSSCELVFFLIPYFLFVYIKMRRSTSSQVADVVPI